MKATIIPVTPFEQNCSLIWCEDTMQAAVIDPGGDLDRIHQAIKETGVTVEKILITHAHIDHAGSAGELAKTLNVDIEGPHKGDSFWVDMIEKQGTMFGITGAGPFDPSRWLVDGDSVTVGNTTLQVLHCPGHTPGHVIFFSEADKLAIIQRFHRPYGFSGRRPSAAHRLHQTKTVPTR